MPCSSAMVSRSRSPIWVGRPRRRTAPAMSRKASSSESGSTLSVIEAKVAMIASEIAA